MSDTKPGDDVFDEPEPPMDFTEAATTGVIELVARPFPDFKLPPKDDPSILIGNRWLSRGDIAILASTSGMGKSSLSLQAATHWALKLPLFGGFPVSRPLKSLFLQAEDGDGDIAEMFLSFEHAMGLTPEQVETMRANVIIVTDRIHRGLSFRRELKRLLTLHHPDLVWINPLLAFLAGDVKDSTDVGQFLREQLNSLNEPPTFAYIIVHHANKPPKERAERQWNEVMYEMTGSADLTNAARAILSLQATATEGQFKLIGAKRGLRAGLTRKVPGTLNASIMFDEPTAVINVKHSKERLDVGGQNIPVIHWTRCDDETDPERNKGGRPSLYTFADISKWVPATAATAKPHQQIYKDCEDRVEFKGGTAKNILIRAAREGLVKTVDRPGLGQCYYLPVA